VFDETSTARETTGEFGKESNGLTVTVRGAGGKLCDEVDLCCMMLERLVVGRSPFVAVGKTLEIVMDDAELMLSYRFVGKVRWTREETDGLVTAGIDLVGVPVLVCRGTRGGTRPIPIEAPARPRRHRLRAVAA
jgi:hypothetical protein